MLTLMRECDGCLYSFFATTKKVSHLHFYYRNTLNPKPNICKKNVCIWVSTGKTIHDIIGLQVKVIFPRTLFQMQVGVGK